MKGKLGWVKLSQTQNILKFELGKWLQMYGMKRPKQVKVIASKWRRDHGMLYDVIEPANGIIHRNVKGDRLCAEYQNGENDTRERVNPYLWKNK